MATYLCFLLQVECIHLLQFAFLLGSKQTGRHGAHGGCSSRLGRTSWKKKVALFACSDAWESRGVDWRWVSLIEAKVGVAESFLMSCRCGDVVSDPQARPRYPRQGTPYVWSRRYKGHAYSGRILHDVAGPCFFGVGKYKRRMSELQAWDWVL